MEEHEGDYDIGGLGLNYFGGVSRGGADGNGSGAKVNELDIAPIWGVEERMMQR